MNNNIILSQESGVRSQESGVRSQESGVRSQESGVRPVVSFCIPFYNRAEIAAELVNGILVSDDPRFEVIIRDNASTDKTPEILSQINDPRFRYVRDNNGVTPFMNWLKALELGHGDWLFLVMGRDRINGKYIPKLIEYLELAEKEGITYLYDGYSKKGKVIMYTGIKAMMRFIAYDHPTGSIFKGDLFRAIPDRESYFINSPELYPENYLRRDLLLQGKGAQIVSGVYISPSYMIDFSQVKSTVESDKDLYDMWYAPKRRTSQTIELIDMVELDAANKFTKSELDQFFSKKFLNVLRSVSLGWRDSCGSEEMQAHYGQKVKHVGILEMARNIAKCYHDIKAHLIENGTYSRSRQLIMYGCILKTSARTLFKLTLENLGIWQGLRFVKHLIIRR